MGGGDKKKGMRIRGEREKEGREGRRRSRGV